MQLSGELDRVAIGLRVGNSDGGLSGEQCDQHVVEVREAVAVAAVQVERADAFALEQQRSGKEAPDPATAGVGEELRPAFGRFLDVDPQDCAVAHRLQARTFVPDVLALVDLERPVVGVGRGDVLPVEMERDAGGVAVRDHACGQICDALQGAVDPFLADQELGQLVHGHGDLVRARLQGFRQCDDIGGLAALLLAHAPPVHARNIDHQAMRNTGFVAIDSVGVVGLGTMGAGIAEVFARSGFEVVAVEVDDALVDAGRRRIETSLGRAVDRGRLEPAERDAIVGRLTFTSDRSRLTGADLVIEAVPERLEIKASLFDELDRICPPETILATNTSSLPVTQIAAATGRPGRVVGMHFFNPAPVMRLVEVVHTVLSDTDAVESVRDLATRCGKIPVVVADRAGFVANALLFGYLNQAARMAETHHATTTDIDTAMTAACGLPMGPLLLMDLIGLDVCLEVLEVMYAETRDQRYAAAPLLRRLVMAHHLGRKSGRGYYSYENGGAEAVVFGDGFHGDAEPHAVQAVGPTVTVAGADDQLVADVTKLLTGPFDLAADAATADVVVHVPTAPRHGTVLEVATRTQVGRSAADRVAAALEGDGRTVVMSKDRPGYIVEALLYPHLNDAARMVDDGYASQSDVDTAMRLGCGYPTGPFGMLDAVGAGAVVERLPAIASSMPSPAVAVSALLHDLARG